MKTAVAIGLYAALFGSGCVYRPMDAQASSPLRQVAAIQLPHMRGRIEHLVLDLTRPHVLGWALGNETGEVVDVASATHLQSVSGFEEPQRIAVLPDSRAVAISHGSTGRLRLMDAQTLTTRWTIEFGGDADNVG